MEAPGERALEQDDEVKLIEKYQEYENSEDFESAINFLSEAIRLQPHWALAHCLLGLAYSNKARDEDSIASFKEAIRLKPDFQEPHYYLGVVCSSLLRFDEALPALRRAVQLEPALEAYFEHAIVCHYFSAENV